MKTTQSWTATLLGSVMVMLAVGCGDNTKVDPDAGPGPADAGIDALVCAAPAAGAVGGPCTDGNNAMCDTPGGPGGDGFCLGPSQIVGWPAVGYCVTFNGCTDDASCGDGNVCADLMGDKACLPACCTGSLCPTGEVCTTKLLQDDFGADACIPANVSARDGASCTGFFDCDEGSVCNRDTLEFPGGQCQTVQCTPGTDTTCASTGDGHCIDGLVAASGTYAGCVDECNNDGDCRQAEGYVCFDGGEDGKYCRHPLAGDPCSEAADCGNPAVWSCEEGAGFTGGYCTVRGCVENGAGCSLGSSHCWDAGNDSADADNFCVDRCGDVQVVPVQSTCRPGYTCQDVNRDVGTVVGGCLPSAI